MQDQTTSPDGEAIAEFDADAVTKIGPRPSSDPPRWDRDTLEDCLTSEHGRPSKERADV